MAFAERVRRARRRRCCEARFSAAALSRASSSAAARAFASALDAVPSESVDVRTGTAPKLPAWATVNPEFSPHRKRWASPRGERLSRPQVATPKHLATRDQRARAGAEKPVLMREGGVRGVDAK